MKTLRQLALAASLSALAAVSVGAQTAGQDVKNSGHDTADATKQTAHKVKHGTKKGVHKAAHGTQKGAHKVEQKTDPNKPQ